MTLIELGGASAVDEFITKTKNAVVTFSAHWCGPCKASKPALEQLARKYASDVNKDVKIAIVYESELGDGIHKYSVRAFPTYVLFQNFGRETNRVEGANISGVEAMIESAEGIERVHTGGETLGGGSTAVSVEDARKARLSRLSGGSTSTDTVSGQVEAPTSSSTSSPSERLPADSMEIETDTLTEPNENAEDMMCVDGMATTSTTAVDPTTDLNPEFIKTLTEEMGFTLLRAQKGLLNGNGNNVEGAVEWLLVHQDDADIDEPIPMVAPPVAQSYRCNECGKVLSNVANLELHANKTGHSDFSESTEHVKPLSAEEKATKIAEIKELLKVKRAEREEKEQEEEISREKQRRFMGKEMLKTKEQLDAEQRKREAYLRRKEKEDFKVERERLRQQLAQDKAERAAGKGKLSSKLSVEGYKPDMIQHNEANSSGNADTGPLDASKQKKKIASASKIPEYIEKVASYRAGGDGGKCLKILKVYVSNIVDNPSEEKFRTIKMDNNAYKTKVKPFLGAKSLLMAVGFHPDERNENLILSNDAIDLTLLSETKTKIEAAINAYG